MTVFVVDQGSSAATRIASQSAHQAHFSRSRKFATSAPADQAMFAMLSPLGPSRRLRPGSPIALATLLAIARSSATSYGAAGVCVVSALPLIFLRFVG